MNIIINGGTSGIGKEIVHLFAGESTNRILVTGRNRDSLLNLTTKAINSNIIPYHLDLTTIREKIEETRLFIRENFSDVDILINNAGLLIANDFLSFKETDARNIMETNLFGPATLIRIVEPLLTEGSHIVNISSMGGYQGSSKYVGLSYYSASKSALACLTECLAEEFKEKHIIVNCLALGSVQTDMFNEAFPGNKADVSARDMAGFIADFAVNGKKFFNGKVIPVALKNP